MKRSILVIFIVLMLWGGQAMADFIKHPMYAKISTFTASVVSQILNKQNEFFLVNGRYFQGLWLLGDTQVDGTTDETIIESNSPDDFNFTWRDFDSTVFKKNIKIPVNIKIDVYEAPDGWGWIFFAEVYIDGYDPDEFGTYGDHWIYRHHEGPEKINGIFDKWYIEIEGP
ncbi:MAG: hypothetical protein KAS32_01115 [Candidatus Peribacteraceae bacterium]|nr:hypothetical protein [Candidatus Peribacteraceae bacterium]